MLPALRKLLPATAAFAAAAISIMAGEVSAQQTNGGTGAQSQGAPVVVVPQRGVGGYSLTLRDVWGPAKMPPPPKDFGPHFDFPPEPLNGGLSHDPYPN